MMPRIHTLKELSAVSPYAVESSLPPRARPSKRFTDKTANDLTAAVIGFFKCYPCCDAWRVNSMGVFDQKTGNFRTSGSRNGIADVCGLWQGRHIEVEIKIKKDKVSAAQQKHFAKVAAAGGVVFIARTFEQFTRDFWAWIDGDYGQPVELFTAPRETIEVPAVTWLDFLLDSVNDESGKVCEPSTRKYLIELYNTLKK